jgi:hypothetical protein
MFSCKAHEILRKEAYFYEYAAMTKDECNAADGRLGRSDRKETDSLPSHTKTFSFSTSNIDKDTLRS